MILKFWKILCECALEKLLLAKDRWAEEMAFTAGLSTQTSPCAWQPLNVHTTWGSFPREAWAYRDCQKNVAGDMGKHLPGPSCASPLLTRSPWGSHVPGQGAALWSGCWRGCRGKQARGSLGAQGRGFHVVPGFLTRRNCERVTVLSHWVLR